MFWRLAIQQALTADLESIAPANGYAHDLAGRVYRGRRYLGEETPRPFVSIMEAPEQESPEWAAKNGDVAKRQYVLLVQGFADDDHLNPTDPALLLLADVERKLLETRASGGLEGYYGMRFITDMRLGGSVVRPAEDPSQVAHFWLQLTFMYAGPQEV